MGLFLRVQDSKTKGFGVLNPENGNDRRSRNVGKKLTLFAS